MDSSSSNKRPRTNSKDDEAPDPKPITTRSEPWFEDGNVILETEHVQFCVHRSILSKRSTIFADMFGLAESSTTAHGGLPIVQLTDSSQELAYLLEWMYEPL